ncbi:MAG: outer membrane beta-barrel protein [Pseudomonadota bacterium]
MVAAASFGPLSIVTAQSAQAFQAKAEAGELSGTVSEARTRKRWDGRKEWGALGVKERDRKPWFPEGIRFGNYIIMPTGEVETEFSDNVYATAKDRVADFAVALEPSVRLISQFKRHQLNFTFGGRFVDYLNENELDEANAYAAMDGALHIDHGHTISMSLLSDYSHEAKLAVGDDTIAVRKTPVWHNKVALGITRDAGRLYGTLGASYNGYNFDDVPGQSGASIELDQNDTHIFASDLQVSYRFSPGYNVTGVLRGMRTLKPTVEDGYGSDNWGMDALVGLNVESSRILHWSFLAGYGVRDFDDPEIETAGKSLFQLGMRWIATQRATIFATARRGFDFTKSEEGVLTTGVAVNLELEALTNLIFTVSGAYQRTELLKSDREDFRWSGGLNMTYLHSKHVHFTASYLYDLQGTSISDDVVETNRIWFGVKFLY